MKEWKDTEVISVRTTLKLWIQLQGDKQPGAYTAGDVSTFHQQMQQLPNRYYHTKAFRTIYEEEGVLALIEKDEGPNCRKPVRQDLEQSQLDAERLFKWCAAKGDALPK